MNKFRVVQLYDVVRTAHLERVRGSPIPTTILYRYTRYDFDQDLARSSGAQKTGILRTFAYALTTDIDVLEVNEPLIASATIRTLSAIAGNQLRSLLKRKPPADVVSYAIENLNPREMLPSLPMKARLKWHLQATLIPVVWRYIDRLAFGTELASETYAGWFRHCIRGPLTRVIPALPCAATDILEVTTSTLVFLGDLSERKGFPLVLKAWDRVRTEEPEASMTILGKGVGRDSAQSLAERDGRVTFHHDPSRTLIFETLRSAKVLTLPSQPSPRWREQVGLPIVEGLSQGCLIVTTTETGLASWLGNHGHAVIQKADDVYELSDALLRTLRAERTRASVTSDLPLRDGREEAAEWMWSRVFRAST